MDAYLIIALVRVSDKNIAIIYMFIVILKK